MRVKYLGGSCGNLGNWCFGLDQGGCGGCRYQWVVLRDIWEVKSIGFGYGLDRRYAKEGYV